MGTPDRVDMIDKAVQLINAQNQVQELQGHIAGLNAEREKHITQLASLEASLRTLQARAEELATMMKRQSHGLEVLLTYLEGHAHAVVDTANPDAPGRLLVQFEVSSDTDFGTAVGMASVGWHTEQQNKVDYEPPPA